MRHLWHVWPSAEPNVATGGSTDAQGPGSVRPGVFAAQVSTAETMDRIFGDAASAGCIADRECPGALALVTGSPLNAYRPLTPEDEFYADALVAWRGQGFWGRDTHYAWARLALRVWPVADGQVARAEQRSWWVWSWRRFGVHDEVIAQRLGIELDSLRRTGVLARADDHARWFAQTPHTRRRWERAPLVVAPERDEHPHQWETWEDPRLRALYPPQVKRLQREFDDLTRAGPPGVTRGTRN